jgi:hypothetical protein
VIVDVIGALDVIDTVVVAVHVHGNDTVIVIRPVDGRRNHYTIARVRRAPRRDEVEELIDDP